MAKERKTVGLRPVDEASKKAGGFVRLHGDSVEEVAQVVVPPVRLGGGKVKVGATAAATKDEMRMRSDDADLGALVEKDEMAERHDWDDPAATPKKIVPWGWFVLLGCAFVGAITWSLVNVSRSKDKQGTLVVDAKSIMERESEDEMAAEALLDEIESSVRGFFNSRSPGEMLRFVRHPERVAPLMERFYGGNPPALLRIEAILSLDPITIEKKATFWIVSLDLEGSEVSQVIVEVITPKEVRVDWETFVVYQPMDWDEFARSRPGGYTGDFRVYVSPDNFYSHEFADSDALSSFRLTTLRGEEILYGYAPKNSALEAKILDLIEINGRRVTPMVLRLHLSEGIKSKTGVVIDELVCPRWLFAENPDVDKP